MNYQEALGYITELQRKKGSEYSLEPVRRLCELAGNPDQDLSIVHITGTNGKGSIGSYLGSIMAMSGYTVGRYVSPTLLDYRERVQRMCRGRRLPEQKYMVSASWELENSVPGHGETEDSLQAGIIMGSVPGHGETGDDLRSRIITEYITEQETAELLTYLRSLAEQMEAQEGLAPTAFEIETVMAFLAMKQWGVDIAIIECGMGGRMDATNILTKPMLCLFSHIGLDHTAFLGKTVEEIAREKAGILKPGCTAVSVKQDRYVEEVLEKACLEQDIPLIIADSGQADQVRYDMEGMTFRYQGVVQKMGQQGTYQIENAVAAIEAAKALRRLVYEPIQENMIQDAVAISRNRGRFECVCEKPYVVVDGAHNPQAAAELRKSLQSYFPGESFTYICGVFWDKDYVQIMEEMLPFARRVYTVKPPGERGLPEEALADCVETWGNLNGKNKYNRKNQPYEEQKFQGIEIAGGCRGETMFVQPCSSVAEALEGASQKPERILVFGSLSFLHEVYEYFGIGGSQHGYKYE